MSEIRYCHDCALPHAENCTKCFSFGFFPDGRIIAAAEALEWQGGDFVVCDVCLGTPYGVLPMAKQEHLT